MVLIYFYPKPHRYGFMNLPIFITTDGRLQIKQIERYIKLKSGTIHTLQFEDDNVIIRKLDTETTLSHKGVAIEVSKNVYKNNDIVRITGQYKPFLFLRHPKVSPTNVKLKFNKHDTVYHLPDCKFGDTFPLSRPISVESERMAELKGCPLCEAKLHIYPGETLWIAPKPFRYHGTNETAQDRNGMNGCIYKNLISRHFSDVGLTIDEAKKMKLIKCGNCEPRATFYRKNNLGIFWAF